jgi:hypothetical protein
LSMARLSLKAQPCHTQKLARLCLLLGHSLAMHGKAEPQASHIRVTETGRASEKRRGGKGTEVNRDGEERGGKQKDLEGLSGTVLREEDHELGKLLDLQLLHRLRRWVGVQAEREHVLVLERHALVELRRLRLEEGASTVQG